MSTPASEVRDFIAELRASQNLASTTVRIGEWDKERDTERLVALYEALGRERAVEPDLPGWKLSHSAERIEQVLALTPHARGAEAVLRLSLQPRPGGDLRLSSLQRRLRELGSMLGAGKPVKTLRDTLGREANNPALREVLACWLHERVLRGTDMTGHPEAQRFQEGLKAARHPLALLPLVLGPLEDTLHRCASDAYAVSVQDNKRESAPLLVPRPPLPPLTDDAFTSRAVEVRDEALSEQLAAAVANWTEESNGIFEARVFSLRPPVPPPALNEHLLRALGLECLLGAEASLDARLLMPDVVLERLFLAAARGGAYSRGVGDAYGRWAAWRSLGALCGAPEDWEPPRIATEAQRCTWLSFGPSSEWFHHVAWDLGFAALRPDGGSVAVLAATDTD